MKNTFRSTAAAIAVLIAGAMSAGADTTSYSWSGTTNTLPDLYPNGGDNYTNKGGIYEMRSGRLHVNSPGAQGWIDNSFNWDTPLTDSQSVTGSVTFRVNYCTNDVNNLATGLGRVRLFWFNATYNNGLNAFVGLYGSDKWTTRNSEGGWHAGGHGEWNKWEYNPSDAGAMAPAGKVYVYSAFNMNDPATDPDFYRAIDKGTDHVLSWNAQYVADCDVIKVTTALDGVPWTVTLIGRQFNNLGWGENALAKQHGSMQGPWDAEYTQINWSTFTLPTPLGDTKNYYWNALGGCLPPLYLGGGVNYPSKGGAYSNDWRLGRLHVDSPGGQGWIDNSFNWNGSLANNESVSGSVTFRVNYYTNDINNLLGGLGRVRLFAFNAPFTNGLHGFAVLYGSDKWMKRSSASPWKPDIKNLNASSEWGKWEFNPEEGGAYAPEGMVYVYNSFDMNNPAANTDYNRPIAKGTDHVFSWTVRYLPICDVVQVDTALDGLYWSTTYVDRKFNNLNWDENALAKQHGSMQGPWAAEYSQINWTTTTTPLPTDTKHYWWSQRQNIGPAESATNYPPLYVGGSNYFTTQIDGWYAVWEDTPVLWVGSGNVNDPNKYAAGWVDNSFNWNGMLADNEKVSGSFTFLVENFLNSHSGNNPFGRVRLLWVNAPYANGLNAFAGLYVSDKKTTRSEGWGPGGYPEWNRWEYNPNVASDFAPAGQVYLYNSFNMNDPASDLDFFRAIDSASASPHTFSWSAQYIPARDVVRVTTALDDVPWTTTDVNRNFLNLGWAENALTKQHGAMQDGAWSAAFGVLTWTTAPADPTLTITKLGDGNVQLTWPFGTLLEASSIAGPWTPVVATSPHTATPSGQKFYRVLLHH